MSYVFTDYNQMVGKRPRQVYWKELQDAIKDLEAQVSSASVNIIGYKSAMTKINEYPFGTTCFHVAEDEDTGYPSLDGIVETVYINEFRNIQHFFEFTDNDKVGRVYYRQWKPIIQGWTAWVMVLATEDVTEHFEDEGIHLSPVDRERIEGYSHYQPSVAQTWVIEHNLNKYPSVTVTDSSGNVVTGDVKYIDSNRVEVNFTSGFSGRAYLN